MEEEEEKEILFFVLFFFSGVNMSSLLSEYLCVCS